MENTGRIRRPILPLIQKKLLHRSFKALTRELSEALPVDKAHLVMLAECGIVERAKVAALLSAMDRLQNAGFEPLRGRTASRGAYLLLEDYLIETEGPAVGGVLQTARSRNDWSATIHKLRLRRGWAALLRSVLRLQRMLLRRSQTFVGVVMPAYTHRQPAMPSTLGHYLAGVGQALSRQIEFVYQAAEGLRYCPLGAGAVGGTAVPIDCALTARLLGFDGPCENSIDAVASRDGALQIIAAASILCTTVSRLCADLLTWSGPEFAFIILPDEVVGSSSAMPQKRNPFVLEHIQGLASAPLGVFVAASTAMHSQPFTHSIAAGTEAVRDVQRALKSATSGLDLCRVMIAKLRPNCDAMLKAAVKGQTSSLAIATQLALEGGLDFRTAHRLVGQFIASDQKDGSCDFDPARVARELGVVLDTARLDPASVVENSRWGGGPAPSAVKRSVERSAETCRNVARKLATLEKQWSGAEAELILACQNTVASGTLQPSPELLPLQT